MQRPLLLNGFMATGKSTVGRELADRTGRPFLDLDQQVETQAGKSVQRIFAEDGEAAFRQLEAQALGRLLDDWQSQCSAAPVCALGGGALLDRGARLRALRHAVVVSLTASPETILKRTQGSKDRPLLEHPDPRRRVEDLLGQRQLGYSEANAVFATDDESKESLAKMAAEIWKRDSIAVAAGDRSYVVEIGRTIVEQRLPALIGAASGALGVTDEVVSGLYQGTLDAALSASGFAPRSVTLPSGERFKTTATMDRIWRAAYDAELDRKGCLVALGGGVVTDMTGFGASTWLRGIAWAGIPTTLLAMVDASVGGKTGVDFALAKNSVGTFWQPCGVLCDVSFLATESERAFLGALSEVVKTGLLGDPQLFELLEGNVERARARDPELLEEMVRRSVAVKAWVVGSDERESGLRATLNLGHTVGHALESQGGYERLTHGEAVSLGLVAALQIGVKLGITPKELAERTTRLLQVLGLPTAIANEPLKEAAALIGRDKKRAGKQVKLIVATELGGTQIHPIAVKDLERLTLALAG